MTPRDLERAREIVASVSAAGYAIEFGHCANTALVAAIANLVHSETSMLQRKLYDAHADLSADGGVTERECECDDCRAYRGGRGE
jgi:hypothetical protein